MDHQDTAIFSLWPAAWKIQSTTVHELHNIAKWINMVFNETRWNQSNGQVLEWMSPRLLVKSHIPWYPRSVEAESDGIPTACKSKLLHQTGGKRLAGLTLSSKLFKYVKIEYLASSPTTRWKPNHRRNDGDVLLHVLYQMNEMDMREPQPFQFSLLIDIGKEEVFLRL